MPATAAQQDIHCTMPIIHTLITMSNALLRCVYSVLAVSGTGADGLILRMFEGSEVFGRVLCARRVRRGRSNVVQVGAGADGVMAGFGAGGRGWPPPDASDSHLSGKSGTSAKHRRN